MTNEEYKEELRESMIEMYDKGFNDACQTMIDSFEVLRFRGVIGLKLDRLSQMVKLTMEARQKKSTERGARGEYPIIPQ